MQEDGRGKLIPLPVSFFSLLGQTGSGPVFRSGSGPAQTRRSMIACWAEIGPTQSGPSSAQPFFVRAESGPFIWAGPARFVFIYYIYYIL